jgi:F0F1-type ATP synthase assembly protein I
MGEFLLAALPYFLVGLLLLGLALAVVVVLAFAVVVASGDQLESGITHSRGDEFEDD